jgi:hypothetical protein
MKLFNLSQILRSYVRWLLFTLALVAAAFVLARGLS